MVLQEHLSVGFSENLRSVWHLHAILFVLFFLKKKAESIKFKFYSFLVIFVSLHC